MKILFGWEMGAGMGHLKSHRSLFATLKARGHELHVVSREVGKAARAFDGLDLPIWQAPFSTEKPEPYLSVTPSMAQVLHNTGLDRIDAVLARTKAWDLLRETIRPDLVLVDSAPTLLLSLRGQGVPAASLSTGFFVPPDIAPLPRFAPFKSTKLPPGTPSDELVTLAALNAVLAARKQPPMSHLGRLFNEGIVPLLTTFKVLDHYPERLEGEYVGLPPSPSGAPPVWPEVPGPRIYAYLKPAPGFETILSQLRSLAWPTLIVSDGIPQETQRHYSCPTLSFAPRALDLNLVSESAQLCLCNANHGTLAHFLLAGIPVLLFPLFLEQEILAAHIVNNKSGLSLSGDELRKTAQSIRELIEHDSYRKAAQRFAQEHTLSQETPYLEALALRLERIARL